MNLSDAGRLAPRVHVKAGPHVLRRQERPLLRHLVQIAQDGQGPIDPCLGTDDAQLRAAGDNLDVARLLDQAQVLVPSAKEAERRRVAPDDEPGFGHRVAQSSSIASVGPSFSLCADYTRKRRA